MSTVMSPEELRENAVRSEKSPLFVPNPGRVFDASGADPVAGKVIWKPSKSLWNGGMTLAALVLGPLTFTPGAFAVFFVTYVMGLCLGQSLGMHRLLIHRSFECPLWLERLFVYFGTVAGLQGPFSWIRNHDLRDWAQSEPKCHPYLSQQSPIGRDYFWQLHCVLELDKPPRIEFEPRVANDRFYHFLEDNFRLQQLPIAVLFYAIGGWPWVIWGVCARIAATVTGAWNLLYWAHNEGLQNWLVKGAGVQGYNVPYSSWLSMGEAWHNNHHAYPLSARFGMKDGEADPAWLTLKALAKLGLVRDMKTPETLPPMKPLEVADGTVIATAPYRLAPSLVNPAPAARCPNAAPGCASEKCSGTCPLVVTPGTASSPSITY